MKLSKLRKLKKSVAAKPTALKAQVDTSMAGAVNEVLFFASTKGY